MTNFENLELIYNQFFNLADEINVMIENEDYSAAIVKLKYKDKLIKKFLTTKKTVELSIEDRRKLTLMEKKLNSKEQNNINFLSKLHKEVGEELKDTNKKLKMNTAYEIKAEHNSGVFVDLSE